MKKYLKDYNFYITLYEKKMVENPLILGSIIASSKLEGI